MKKLVVANWKMNLLREEIKELLREVQGAESVTTVLCPAYPYLDYVGRLINDQNHSDFLHLGAQDCHNQNKGAYTGDVSAEMLADLGCEYVILGHSERRQQYQESSRLISQKVQLATSKGLIPIICIGETDEENREGKTKEVIEQQINLSVPRGSQEIIIAYEPVWAIGTGRTPTNKDIERVHDLIRECLSKKSPMSDSVPILYGGSVNDKNSEEIMNLDNVDGVLVGGASLKAEGFNQIIQKAVS